MKCELLVLSYEESRVLKHKMRQPSAQDIKAGRKKYANSNTAASTADFGHGGKVPSVLAVIEAVSVVVVMAVVEVADQAEEDRNEEERVEEDQVVADQVEAVVVMNQHRAKLTVR